MILYRSARLLLIYTLTYTVTKIYVIGWRQG